MPVVLSGCDTFEYSRIKGYDDSMHLSIVSSPVKKRVGVKVEQTKANSRGKGLFG